MPMNSAEGLNSPERAVKPAWAAPYYIKACALGIPAYLIGAHLWTWVLTVSVFLGGRADFRQLYTAGYMVRTGYRYALYDYSLQARFENSVVGPSNTPLPFNHLSYESLFFLPLSSVSYRSAYFVFLVFNLLLLAVSFYLLRAWVSELGKVYLWLPAALFAAFLPVGAALIQGQDSIMLLGLFVVSFVLLQSARDAEAGVLIGLGLFKFQIVLPIAVFFLAWRRWRFLLGFGVSAVATLSLSTCLVGVAQMRLYAQWILSMSTNANAADYTANAIRPDHMPNIRGIVFGFANSHLLNSWIQAGIGIISAAVLVWVIAQNRLRQGGNPLLVAITAASILSYHLLIHDLAILLLPVLVTLDRFIKSEPTGSVGDKFLFRSAVLVFCVPLVESFFPNYFFLVCIPIFLFLWALLMYGQKALPLYRECSNLNHEPQIPLGTSSTPR
jgi:hypothetical protein